VSGLHHFKLGEISHPPLSQLALSIRLCESEVRHPVSSVNVPTGLSSDITAKLLARIFAGVLDLQPQARQ